jgi:hypothetical protein
MTSADPVFTNGPARAIKWGEFAALEPDLARFGAGRLRATLPSYLATVRRSGAPRVRPVTPIFRAHGLYLFMEPTSPKRRDLLATSWYGMHSGVPDNAGTGGEFSIEGGAVPVDDSAIWTEVAEASGYDPPERYILFEFFVSEARCHGYGDVPLPDTRKWVIG